MVKLDPTNDFHKRAADHLTNEEVVWFVTTSADGTPQPSPVWFVWDGDSTVVIYSQNNLKVRNIADRSRVALHFNSDHGGDDVVIFTGSAAIDQNHAKVVDFAPYRAKYDQAIVGIGYTAESFSESYSVPVVVTLEKVRGH